MERSALVEAPDAFAGFVLAEKLARLAPDAHVEPRGESFWVAAALELEQLPAALRIVQRWLQDERIDATRVRVSEREFRLAA